MQTIFEARGHLCAGYTGHVSFDMKLPHALESMSVTLALGPLKPAVSPPPREGENDKNEVHLEACLDGVFIGGQHRQAQERQLRWGTLEEAEGCLPVRVIEGMLTVRLLVFHVLPGGLDYQVTAIGTALEPAAQQEHTHET